MSSFKELVPRNKATTAELAGWLQAALTGMARNAMEGAEPELNSFRGEVDTLAKQVRENASSSEIKAAVHQALELLRQHNDRNLKFNQARSEELKAVMRTMTETITYLSESRTRSVHHLQYMERELEQASQIDDIRQLHSQLIRCLDVVRQETSRLQSESESGPGEARNQNQTPPKDEDPATGRLGTMDPVTGLPARRAAERMITDALAQGNENAIAIFVVKRIAAINAKFGRAVGDEVMLRVANHYAQYLSASTMLYRWSGPALLAISPVYNNSEELKRSWAKASSGKLEVNLETNQRTVFVMAEMTMSFQVVQGKKTVDELFATLDRFVAEQPQTAR